MFFTQEDYKKIYEWISRNSIKDTEFNEALTPLDETDTITLVQNGVNVRISLKDLIDQLFLMGVSDFLNITDKFGEKNITLDQAIELIPYKSRKLGQVITFLDNNNKWKVYQFKGELTQWDQLNLWEDILDIEAHTINSILPDEEDLTKTLPDDKGNSYLSFKDREYNPEDFSGFGRIILRKNIVEVEDPIYGKVKKNILYQDMFTQSNTIYEIRYDFDLNGQDITLPNNSYIEYNGGSISNGNIIDNAKGLNRIILRKNIKEGKNILTQELINKPNTIYIIQYDYDLNGAEITMPENCVLQFEGGSLNNGVVVGKLLNDYVKPEWFGAKGDGDTDDFEAFKIAISLHKNVKLSDKTYFISKAIELPGGTTIEGSMKGREYNVVGNESNSKIKTETGAFILAESYIQLKNIYFQSKSQTDSCITLSTPSSWTVEHKLENIKIVSYNIGIEFTSTMGSALNTFDNIYFNSCKVGVKNVNQVPGDLSYSNRFTNCAFWFCDEPLYVGNGSYTFISCGIQLRRTNAIELVPHCTASFVGCSFECDYAVENNGALFVCSGDNVNFVNCNLVGNRASNANIGWFYIGNSCNICINDSSITYYNIEVIFPLLFPSQTPVRTKCLNINNSLYRRDKSIIGFLNGIPDRLLHIISINGVVYLRRSDLFYKVVHDRISSLYNQIIGILDGNNNIINYAVYNGNHITSFDQIDASLRIVYFDSYWKTCSLYDWGKLAKDGKTAQGILVKEGNKRVVIPINYSTSLYKWSPTRNKNSKGYKTTKSKLAINDFDGEYNTNEIIKANGIESSYASKYCRDYNTDLLESGKWSLPSLGEMMLILKYKDSINYGLSLFDNATIITDDLYWTSTESEELKAWAVRGYDSYIENSGFDKNLGCKVIPVISISASIQNEDKGCVLGQSKFSEALNKPIWWTGTKWVDATGTDV